MLVWKTIFYAIAGCLSGSIGVSAKVIEPAAAADIPDECRGLRFCHIKPKNYDLLEKKMQSLLPHYLINGYNEENVVNDLEERWTSDSNQKAYDLNCHDEMKTSFSPIKYKYLPNNSEKPLIIVQTETFVQKIDEVICAVQTSPTENNQQCFQGLTADSYKSSCEPVHINRTIYVLNDLETAIVRKVIPVSVTCSCMVAINI